MMMAVAAAVMKEDHGGTWMEGYGRDGPPTPRLVAKAIATPLYKFEFLNFIPTPLYSSLHARRVESAAPGRERKTFAVTILLRTVGRIRRRRSHHPSRHAPDSSSFLPHCL